VSRYNQFNFVPRASLRGIGSTDARRIAAGDWPSLWDEKTGKVEPPSLQFAWKPRLGLCTENLHAWWHGLRECKPRDGLVLVEPKLDTRGKGLVVLGRDPLLKDAPGSAAWASIDRWVVEDDCPLELKHTNERASLATSAAYYMAQLQWQLIVTGCNQLRFSIIRGNNEPEWGYVAEDIDYQIRLAKQVEAFWQQVEIGERPEELAADEVEENKTRARQVPINGYRAYDHGTNNEWCAKAGLFIELKPQAERYKEAEKELRALIPSDASEVAGGGVIFKRDARGAYRVTILDGDQ
jgi:hypothetical protein